MSRVVRGPALGELGEGEPGHLTLVGTAVTVDGAVDGDGRQPAVSHEPTGQRHDVVLALGSRRAVPEHHDRTGGVVVGGGPQDAGDAPITTVELEGPFAHTLGGDVGPELHRCGRTGQLRGTSDHAMSLSMRGSPGRPSTRSPRMLRMISEVPPSMELARDRRNVWRGSAPPEKTARSGRRIS